VPMGVWHLEQLEGVTLVVLRRDFAFSRATRLSIFGNVAYMTGVRREVEEVA